MDSKLSELLTRLCELYGLSKTQLQDLYSQITKNDSHDETVSDIEMSLRNAIWTRYVCTNRLREYLASGAFQEKLQQAPGFSADWQDAIFQHVTDALARELTNHEHPLSKLDEFKTEDKWWAYLLKSCRRRIARERGDHSNNALAVERLESQLPSPIATLIEIEDLERLLEAIDALPRGQRETIIDISFGFTITESSKRQNRSYIRVYRDYAKAIAELRMKLTS